MCQKRHRCDALKALSPLFAEARTSFEAPIQTNGQVAGCHTATPTIPPRRKTAAALVCDIPGCKRKKAFARSFELRRHINQKHGGNRLYACGALGCFKLGSTRWTFPRLDKLTDHIRVAHNYGTAFSGCPVDDCNLAPLPLDVLGFHLQRFHPDPGAEGRAIKNATNVHVRRCPLSGCNNKLFKLEEYLVHLGSHEAEDLRAASSSTCFESLVFDFANSSGTTSAIIIELNINIACPACQTITPTVEQFKMHLWANHLFLNPSQNVGHFLAWKDVLKQRRIQDVEPWSKRVVHLYTSIQCSRCMHSISTLRYYDEAQAQHPGLLKPTEQIILDLMPFRMQILRLYPDFLTHPVFDDCV
jgi:hypothetical protein